MFNRALEMKLVKKNKNETEPSSQKDVHFEGKAAIIGYYFERCIKKAGSIALAYVLLDTGRQVLIAKALKP